MELWTGYLILDIIVGCVRHLVLIDNFLISCLIVYSLWEKYHFPSGVCVILFLIDFALLSVAQLTKAGFIIICGLMSLLWGALFIEFAAADSVFLNQACWGIVGFGISVALHYYSRCLLAEEVDLI